MNSSKRRAFKNSLKNRWDNVSTQRHCTDTCDRCHRRANGIEYSHLGVPVLFLCDSDNCKL
jgi:hypothetical protein